MNDLLDAALEYATKFGIPVFPCHGVVAGQCTCGKDDCGSPGKHPIGSAAPNGLKDATTDPNRIREWWAKFPGANIAGVMGREANLDALDVDVKHGGFDSLGAFVKEHGDLPKGPRSKTGGGGAHFFFLHAETLRPAAGFRPGLDIRSTDSYVILPPSRHVSGQCYAWQTPLGAAVPPWPDWLLKTATEGRPKRGVSAKVKGKPIPEGKRNDELARIAGKLRRLGTVEAAILAQLREVNASRCHPPLPEEEVANIAASISRYEPGDQRNSAPRNVEPTAESAPDPDMRSWPRGDREHVDHFPDRIEWVRETADGGEHRWTVVDGHLEVHGRVDVDGDQYFEVTGSKLMILQADALMRTLQREARVLDRRYAPDAVNLVLRRETDGKVRKVHPAVGVYVNEDGRFELCDKPYPLYKEQEEASRDLREGLGYVGTKEDVQGYVDFAHKAHSYESYPAMGSGAISPFVGVLRGHGVLVAHIFHYSHMHGLGKSKEAEAFSAKLYNRRSVGGDAISSDYRFATHMDAAGTSLTVNEGDRLDPKKLGPVIKDSAESEIVDKRGTPDLGMVTYRSRTVIFVTANALIFSQRTHLTRFLAIRYDDREAQNRHRRENRRAFDAMFRGLKPIGFDVARHAITMYRNPAALLAEVERFREEIENAYSGEFQDARRAQAWAVVYVGLGIWESYCEAKGAMFHRPAVAAFVENVVLPVEASTFEGGVPTISRLIRWWDAERAFNRDLKTGEARGQGEIWESGEIVITGGDKTRKLSGTFFTAALLDRYNKVAEIDLRIPGLKDLSRQVASTYSIDLKTVAGEDECGLVRKIAGRNRRVVFIPDEEPEEPKTPGATQGRFGEDGEISRVDRQNPRSHVAEGVSMEKSPPRDDERTRSDIASIEKGPATQLRDFRPLTRENSGSDEEGGQNPDRMFAFQSARDQARVHPGIVVVFARGEALKEYRARFNREPDPDQFEAGIIGGLKADKERREREGGTTP